LNAGTSQATHDPSSGVFPPEEELAIYVKDAHKSFGVTKALNGVSFRANLGEIHAIVGGNGCGKSTLAKVLSGVLAVDKGEVSVLGHAPKSPAAARALGVATVFQEVMVADEATIAENLFTGADGLWSRTLSTREKLAQARVLMRELTGTDIDPQRPAAGLSLGVKAWITIGRALLCKPKILILDESSAALDFDSTERLFAKMRELRDQGSAVLIVTHRIAELIRISDRATVMRDGNSVGVLEKSEITENNLLNLITGKAEASRKTEHKAPQAISNQVVLRAAGMRVWPDAAPVNFELLKGEIVGVTGLEGHGHDNFVRILAGVTPAIDANPTVQKPGSTQQVEIRGLDDARRNGIAFVSGDRKREGILPNLTIFENLAFPLYRLHSRGGAVGIINWAELGNIFDWEVQRLSIKTNSRNNLITSLSGGNQQKVLIGRAFALRPRILVLNDPARGIDVGTKQELYNHLRDFVADGNSVVYMSSELEEFIGLCARVMVFRNGSVFDTFVNEDVESVGILEGMFGRSRVPRNGGQAGGPSRKPGESPEAGAGARGEGRAKREPDRPVAGPSAGPAGALRGSGDGGRGNATVADATGGRRIKIRYFG
jgi:ribose transport system ATP-binding protein